MLGILGIITGYTIGGFKATSRAGREAARAVTRSAGGGQAFLEKHWASLLAAAVMAVLALQVLVGFDEAGGMR
ncbi:hypothetical protein [Roseospira visakhapatnamensis]|uniref:Uncharacterized protein n=1 Tax=Roseospira visakhapatnamensis TaxID=390880 RepID=A0A7W6WB40_9PROT|nr:hypothetical protein [Roseospira visakhapatnamensis]MBB4267920.1 hypothetical protein [Roseospira visakhapatnamensis]